MNEESWLALCFAIFVILAYRPTKNAIIEFLDAKIKIIRDALHEAQHAKMEAEKEVQLMHTQLALAEEHHKEMLEKARIEIEDLYNKRCIELTKAMEYRMKAAQESLEQMKRDSMAKVEEDFLELVVETVTQQMKSKSSSKLDMQILKTALDQEAA